MSGVRVMVEDLRAAGVCPRAGQWFDAQGLDWRDFVRNGIEAEKLIATGNAIALRVVKCAEARTAAPTEGKNGR